jgi:hypothetical protein
LAQLREQRALEEMASSSSSFGATNTAPQPMAVVSAGNGFLMPTSSSMYGQQPNQQSAFMSAPMSYHQGQMQQQMYPQQQAPQQQQQPQQAQHLTAAQELQRSRALYEGVVYGNNPQDAYRQYITNGQLYSNGNQQTQNQIMVSASNLNKRSRDGGSDDDNGFSATETTRDDSKLLQEKLFNDKALRDSFLAHAYQKGNRLDALPIKTMMPAYFSKVTEQYGGKQEFYNTHQGPMP